MARSDITQRLDDMLGDTPVIPVIAIDDVEDAIPMAEAFKSGGLPVLEITLRTDAALDAMARIRDNVEGVTVGAGTVLSPVQADAAIAAGSKFIVTPGLTDNTAQHILTSGTPLLPGVATASEIMRGLDHGLDFFKFFPAGISGGVPALKSFQGPFKDVIFCPTGGVRENNLADYLSLSNVRVCGGTWLVPDTASGPERWDEVVRLVPVRRGKSLRLSYCLPSVETPAAPHYLSPLTLTNTE